MKTPLTFHIQIFYKYWNKNLTSTNVQMTFQIIVNFLMTSFLVNHIYEKRYPRENISVSYSITPRCLKITEKVSFNIASEASSVYILSGQKLIKKCQKWCLLASFWKPEACGQTVLPDRSVLIEQKLVENAKIQKFKCDILGDFDRILFY